VNIYICGLPRTGKTTLAKKIKAILPNMNLFVSEAIRNGFQKIEEVNEWGNKNSKKRQVDFPMFLKEFLDWNKKFTECDNIVDLALISIEKTYEIANENDIILCLGFGNKTNSEILEIIRMFEKDKDYTKNINDQNLLKLWGDVAIIDKTNNEFCLEHDILYFDTTDREESLNNIVEIVKERL